MLFLFLVGVCVGAMVGIAIHQTWVEPNTDYHPPYALQVTTAFWALGGGLVGLGTWGVRRWITRR
jgi:hypothetical protein